MLDCLETACPVAENPLLLGIAIGIIFCDLVNYYISYTTNAAEREFIGLSFEEFMEKEKNTDGSNEK